MSKAWWMSCAAVAAVLVLVMLMSPVKARFTDRPVALAARPAPPPPVAEVGSGRVPETPVVIVAPVAEAPKAEPAPLPDRSDHGEWKKHIDELGQWTYPPACFTVRFRHRPSDEEWARVHAILGMKFIDARPDLDREGEDGRTYLAVFDASHDARAGLRAVSEEECIDSIYSGEIVDPSSSVTRNRWILEWEQRMQRIDTESAMDGSHWRDHVDVWVKNQGEHCEVALSFRRGATEADHQRVFTKLGVVRVESQCCGSGFRVGEEGVMFYVTVPKRSDFHAVYQALAEDPWIYGLDILAYPKADEWPDDPEFPRNSAFHNTGQDGGTYGADIHALDAWDIWDSPFMIVKVAVIDSGVDRDHRDLAGNLWYNIREAQGLPDVDDDGNGVRDDAYGYNVFENNGNITDQTGHGTSVTGLISAMSHDRFGTAGLCWEVATLPIRAVETGRFTSSRLFLKAFEYAVNSGAEVINCSWTWDYPGGSATLDEAIRYANNAGVLVVCSAGNEPRDMDTCTVFPATWDSPNVITVTGTDQWDRFMPGFAYGAQRVLLAAPGNGVFTTATGNAYREFSGTSASAPQVTGAAALAIGLWKVTHGGARPTIAQLRAALTAGVDPLPSLAGKCATGGRLNVAKVLGALIANEAHAIHGSVDQRASGAPPRTEMTLAGGGSRTTMTEANGEYAFYALLDGTCTVTPSREGFTFSPPSQTIDLRGADVRLMPFRATPTSPRAISGRVRDGGRGVAGALVTVSGDLNASATTAADGSFAIPDLIDGEYFVAVTGGETRVVTLAGQGEEIDFSVHRGLAAGRVEEGAAIRDHMPLASRIRLDEAGSVPDLAVEVDLTHDRPADLRMTLVAPDGTPVLLRAPGGGPLLAGPLRFDHEHLPVEPFSRLAGHAIAGDWTLLVEDDVDGAEGVLTDWRLVPSLRAPHSVSETMRDESIEIRDLTQVESAIDIPESEPADEVQVYVEVRHPKTNDLVVSIVSPWGEEVSLTWGVVGPPDVVGWFGRDLQSKGPLARLAGRSPRGPWRLRARDIAPGGEGRLVRWGLAFVRRPHRAARLVLGAGAGGLGMPRCSTAPSPTLRGCAFRCSATRRGRRVPRAETSTETASTRRRSAWGGTRAPAAGSRCSTTRPTAARSCAG